MKNRPWIVTQEKRTPVLNSMVLVKETMTCPIWLMKDAVKHNYQESALERAT